MEIDMISLRFNGELYGLCLPADIDEKRIDSMVSILKGRLTELVKGRLEEQLKI